MLRSWTRWVTSNAVPVLAVSLLLTAMLATYALQNLRISTDTEDMIAEKLPWRQDFIEFRESFPQRYRTIVVVISAATDSLADISARRLDSRLDDLPALFEDSFAPVGDEPVAGRELLYLDVDELLELADNVAAAQPFIGRLRQDFTLVTLFAALRDALTHDGLEAADEFLGRIGRGVAQTLAGSDTALDWSRSTTDSRSPAHRLIIVKPVIDPALPRPAIAAIAALRHAGTQLENEFDGQVTVRLTGTVALEDEELVSVTRNAKLTGIFAFVSVMAVLLVAFRSLRIVMISIVTLIAGLIGTAAFAAWTVGTLNVISVAFAVLYIGLGIDFAIHYLLRVRELSAEGQALDEVLETASADVGRSLFICAITTAVGFYSFVPTSFVGVSQLGLISGTGMFISLLATLTLLPALMRLSFGAQMTVPAGAIDWRPGKRLSAMRSWRNTAIAVPVLLALVGIALSTGVRFDSDPMQLRDPATPSVQTYRDLSRDPDTAPTSISIVVEPGRDVNELRTQLLAKASVARVVSLDSFALRDVQEKREVLDDLGLLLGPDFAAFPALAPIDVSVVRASIEHLLETLQRIDIGGYAGATVLSSSLVNLRSTLETLPPDAARRLLERLQSNLLIDLPRTMQLLSARLNAAPESSLSPEFVSRWRNAEGDQLLDVIPALDIAQADDAARFVDDVRDVAPHATGLAVVHEEAGRTVVMAFARAFSYAFVAIGLLLMLFMRSFASCALVLTPLLLAAAITGGIMVIIDLPFNFANIIALPLLLGIGVDNGIHLVERARKGGADTDVLRTSTSRAILFSGLTTIASFGNLALSSHRGMSSMGLLLAIGLLVILVTVLVVLPALLKRGDS